uniref:Uncharacterized protein n=1 Tax=Manihot esculenta TaxID=3983 RepID=A0A2C9WMT7_MANES
MNMRAAIGEIVPPLIACNVKIYRYHRQNSTLPCRS